MTLPPLEATLRADRVLTPDAILAPGWIRLAAGRVEAVGGGEPAAAGRLIDLGDRTCVPGFVDLHVHGGNGAQFNSGSAGETREAAAEIARFHAAHGTTALLATTVSDTPERTEATVRGAAAAREGVGGARLVGVHLEGPWLSPARVGAQDPEAIRPVDDAELDRLRRAADGAIRIVTLAPELPGAEAMVGRLVREGTVAAIGHTEADYEITMRALDLGASHFTHLFNAMRPMTHRLPGPAGAALSAGGVAVELIADGHHVHPVMLAMAFRRARSPLLVTDATAAAGLAEGERTSLGRQEVVVREGTVRLAAEPETLAGSALTMDAAVRTMVQRAGVSLRTALIAATATPAAAIGRADLGRLRPGAAADLVVLDPELRVAATIVGGRPLHDESGLLA